MEPITVGELLQATNGTLVGKDVDLSSTITSVETDSRSIRAGGLFIPLVGERFDGHVFLDRALKDGAVGCFTAVMPEECVAGKFYIHVENTQTALGQLAKFYRRKFKIPLIAVTGSVGKTTTKDMLAAVLGKKFKVLKTEGNFNNEVGLPLTLFQLDSSIEICILEMGMNHFGEIAYLAEIAAPDIAVLTNIGDAHIENLGSRENILKAKSEVFTYMQDDAPVILNGDDWHLSTLKDKIRQKIVFVGTNEQFLYQAIDVAPQGEKGLRLTVKTPTKVFPVEVPALGNHMIYPVLSAVVLGEYFGMSEEEMIAGIGRFVPTKMRMNVIQQGTITILDDSYNANPQSMRAALEVLSQRESEYKAAILGDMFELGALAPTLHHGIGEYAGKVGIDCLIAVGEMSHYIYEAASESNLPDVFYCKTKEEAKTVLPQVIRPGATILVKASRGMEFEELVREVKRLCPEN
ncbi:MAG: UDP-N-acetylmuramoyl-tripeptide--D-alanyl-D-alanine ligase [Evtepia sp.]